jgi:uncharacterized RDD family membrane protein YckC
MEEIIDNTSEMSTERVGFGPRFGASILDVVFSIVLGLALAPVGAAIGVGVGQAAGGAMGATEDEVLIGQAAGGIFGMLLGAIAMIWLAAVLYGLIEAFTGASPGKMILGLKIGNQDGTSAEMTTYLIRWAVKNSGTILAALAGLLSVKFIGTIGNLASLAIFVGCFFVLGASRQAFHDLAAKTAVYKKADLK